MSFSDLQRIFNRASSHVFSRKKLTFVSLVLALCGLLIVFFRGVGVDASSWISLSLTFLPIFLCAGILLSMGIVLIRLYHDEIKKRPLSINRTIAKSWELMIGTSYLSLPLLLTYLLLWIILGIFLLLREIPAIGPLITVIFAFAPFLLILGSLVLSSLCFVLLFFVTPVIALRGGSRVKAAQFVVKKWREDCFANLMFLSIGIFPLLLAGGLLFLAAFLTDVGFLVGTGPLYIVLQWFFLMLPFVVLLSPALVFFFNFAAEVHAFKQKRN